MASEMDPVDDSRRRWGSSDEGGLGVGRRGLEPAGLLRMMRICRGRELRPQVVSEGWLSCWLVLCVGWAGAGICDECKGAPLPGLLATTTPLCRVTGWCAETCVLFF